jgi:hypothetical protein
MASRARFGGAGLFSIVRSLVSFLRLRSGRMPRVSSGTYLTYTREWDATKYMQALAEQYLEKRPEYNEGWAAMVNNMKENILTGGYVYGKIIKNHEYYDGAHSVSYDLDWYSRIENATNHPDLMSNYIDELNELFENYFQRYEDSECFGVSSQEEWAIRAAALDEYRDFVEETMSQED